MKHSTIARARLMACRFGWVAILLAMAVTFFLPPVEGRTMASALWAVAGVAILGAVARAAARGSGEQ